MIPNIFVYAYHTQHEFHESIENRTINLETSNEQLNEGIFFLIVTIGYIITTIYIEVKSHKKLSYYISLIGTPTIIVIYFASKTIGVPVLDGFDNWLIDNSTNWKDFVTKVAQQIFVIPLAMMFILLTRKYNKD